MEDATPIAPQQAILAALHRCILNIGKVKKEAKNPRFDSTYATLEQVLDFVNPAVFGEGLVMSQSPGYSGADKAVTMTLSFIDAEGNALNYCTSAVPVGKVYPKNQEPQEASAQTAIAAQTYLARTQIAHVFRLNLTDDDGNEGSGWKPESPARAATPTPASKPSPAPSAAKAREGKGWDNVPSGNGKFTLLGREWTLAEMSPKQLGTVAYSADDRGMSKYPPEFIKMCDVELLRRVAAGDMEATEMVEANS